MPESCGDITPSGEHTRPRDVADVAAAEAGPKRNQLTDQAAVRQLERADHRHRRFDTGVRQHRPGSAPLEHELGAAAHRRGLPRTVGRSDHGAVSNSTSWRIHPMTRSRPSPVFRLVKTMGLPWRMTVASRSITDRSAPTYGARSVLLMTRRSLRVTPGPPLRGTLSPPATSTT